MTLEELAEKVSDLETQLTAVKGNRDKVLSEKKSLKKRIAELEAKIAAGGSDDDDNGDDDDGDDAPPPPVKAKKPTASAAPEPTAIKRLRDEMAQLKAELDGERKSKQALTVDTALSDAFAEAGISVKFRSAASALFKSTRTMKVDGSAVLCDDEPLADAVKSWIDGEEGSAFIERGTSTGSAVPNKSPGGHKPPTGKRRSEMSPSDKGAYLKKFGLDAYMKLPA